MLRIALRNKPLRLSLILTLVLVSIAVATPVPRAFAYCSGHDCDGQDPHQSGCDSSAYSTITSYSGDTKIEIRTGWCSTKWVRTTNNSVNPHYAAGTFYYNSNACGSPCGPSYNVSSPGIIGGGSWVYTAQYFTNVANYGCGDVQGLGPISTPTTALCAKG